MAIRIQSKDKQLALDNVAQGFSPEEKTNR
jgi:hypothetical protein